MSSSPGDRRYPFDSPENKDGSPLYHSTDNFLPLGFSTPQQHRNAGSSSHQQRNYYSAQPKYMLPRQRGFQNRGGGGGGRNQQLISGSGYRGGGGGGHSSPGGEDALGGGQPERRNFNNRNWKGQNFRQQNYNQQRNRNRFGLGHQQRRDNNSYNVNDYFHPSMLEDPWMHLMQKHEQEKPDEGDSSDAGEGGGEGGQSDVGEE